MHAHALQRLSGHVARAATGTHALKIASGLQVTEAEIRQAQRAEREQEKIKKTMKARMDFLEFD